MGSEPSAESSAELPSKIGAYNIERELGRGGMGAVYVGVHDLIAKRAAVKVLLAAASRDEDLVQRFHNEARAASQIHHPGIVEVFDYGIDDGRAYIVMELLEGTSLAARMKAHGRLAIPAAVEIARQVAEALAAAHAAGIVHRDLKPDNIFLRPDDSVVLLDWGIAKLTGIGAAISGARTVTGALLGTPQYMSPEQCEGGHEVDHRSDQYSLGCTLYQMLTGRLPFESTGIGGYIGAHLHVAPPPLDLYCPAGSRELAAIVARLLAKAPGDRFASAEELARALAAPAASEVVRPPPIPSTPAASLTITAPFPKQRRGGLAIVLLLAALAIGFGVALFVKAFADDPSPRERTVLREPEADRWTHVDQELARAPVDAAPDVAPVHEDDHAPERPHVPPYAPEPVVQRAKAIGERPEVRTPAERTGPTTTDEARAIIMEQDKRATLELCRKTPPDRASTVRPCMKAACELGEIALAKEWFKRAIGKKATHDQAVDSLNICASLGVSLYPH